LSKKVTKKDTLLFQRPTIGLMIKRKELVPSFLGGTQTAFRF